jgi:uncharacterized coiled-coil protein SlyX
MATQIQELEDQVGA